MTIDLVRVQAKDTSSVIKKIAYNYALSTLTVTFHDDSVYVYSDVPAETYRLLECAASVGQAFWASVRGQYPSIKVQAGVKKQEQT